MSRINKVTSIALITALAASIILTAEFASAVTRLTVPEFSVEFIDDSFYVPPTATMDPYDGETVAPGYQVVNKTIEITIKDPPSSNLNAYYIVRVKGHFDENWNNVFDGLDLPSTLVITLNSSDEGYYYSAFPKGYIYAPSDGQVDFQVKAVKGHYSQVPAPFVPFPRTPEYLTTFNIDAESDWSQTQTLTIAEASPLNTSALLIMAAVLSIVVILVLICVSFRKLKRNVTKGVT